MFYYHNDTIPAYCAQDFIYGLKMSDLPKAKKKISEHQKIYLAQLIQAHNKKDYSKVIELSKLIPEGIRYNPRMIEIVNNAERRLKQNASNR